jgi:hypothetical protein
MSIRVVVKSKKKKKRSLKNEDDDTVELEEGEERTAPDGRWWSTRRARDT